VPAGSNYIREPPV